MERIADILLSESSYETGSSFSETASYEVSPAQSAATTQQLSSAPSAFLSLVPDETPLPPLPKLATVGFQTAGSSAPTTSSIKVVEVGVVEAGVLEASGGETKQLAKNKQDIPAPTDIPEVREAIPAPIEVPQEAAPIESPEVADAVSVPTPQASLRPDELWAQSIAVLRKQLDPQIFTAWIKPLQIEKFELADRDSALHAEITFIAPNRFCRDHIERHYSELIRATVGSILHSASNDLIFKVVQPNKTAGLHTPTQSASSTGGAQNGSAAPQNGSISSAGLITESILSKLQPTVAPTAKSPAPARRAAPNDESNLNPKYNFSNFVVGGCNQFAHAVSLRVAEDLGAHYNPLFIYGGVGLGKTHLANAIGNSSRRRNKKVLLVSSESFVSELISSLRSNRMEQFKTKFRSIDLLIIDDIQFIIGKERTQEEFFHTFNDLYNRHKQIILTSDKVPQELIGLEERLRTRFASGLSVDLQAPDYETRVAILIKKAENGGFELSEEVARLIAKHIDTNVRELEGALNKLQALSSMHQSPLTLSLAEQVLKSFTPTRQREITAETIQKVVAERFNVSINDLIGKRRTHNIAFARQVAMYLCRKLTGCSYPEIGALFGGRDHSTVIHANRAIGEKAAADPQFTIDLDVIERRLSD